MIRFLKRLITFWNELFQDNDVVVDEEEIARFILTKRHFSAKNKVVKHGAFLPPKSSDETSVYRTATVTDKEKWEIGKKYVAEPREKTILADGVLEVSKAHNICIDGVQLCVTPEKKPHPLHANITKWPKMKERRKLAALELANEAVLNIA